jgi:hypothetical protein
MGSTFTLNGGIEKIGLGEQAGSWGTTTNTNFDIIDRLINGVGELTLSGTSSTLTTSDGSLSNGMFKVLVLGGSPSGTHTITIAPNDADKLYFVKNGTSQSVVFSQGSGADATITAGKGAIIFADGAGSGAAVTDLSSLFVNAQALSGQTIDNSVIGGTTPAAITGTTVTATTSILPDASGGADIGSTSAEFGDVFIADDKAIQFGSDQDVLAKFDTTSSTLQISNGDVSIVDDKKLFFGTDKDVSLEYDEDGTDTVLIDRSSGTELITIADDKKIIFGTDKDVSLEYDEDGTNSLLVTGNVTFADGSTDVDLASHDGSNGLKLGGTLVTRTAAQINSARDGTVTSVATGSGLTGGTITSSGTLSLKDSFLNNTSSAISSGTTTSFTASTYPTFISGQSVSAGSFSFTVTVGGSSHTLSMTDGDSGTRDVFATLLPAGATISGSSFQFVAVQMRPG